MDPTKSHHSDQNTAHSGANGAIPIPIPTSGPGRVSPSGKGLEDSVGSEASAASLAEGDPGSSSPESSDNEGLSQRKKEVGPVSRFMADKTAVLSILKDAELEGYCRRSGKKYMVPEELCMQETPEVKGNAAKKTIFSERSEFPGAVVKTQFSEFAALKIPKGNPVVFGVSASNPSKGPSKRDKYNMTGGVHHAAAQLTFSVLYPGNPMVQILVTHYRRHFIALLNKKTEDPRGIETSRKIVSDYQKKWLGDNLSVAKVYCQNKYVILSPETLLLGMDSEEGKKTLILMVALGFMTMEMADKLVDAHSLGYDDDKIDGILNEGEPFVTGGVVGTAAAAAGASSEAASADGTGGGRRILPMKRPLSADKSKRKDPFFLRGIFSTDYKEVLRCIIEAYKNNAEIRESFNNDTIEFTRRIREQGELAGHDEISDEEVDNALIRGFVEQDALVLWFFNVLNMGKKSAFLYPSDPPSSALCLRRMAELQFREERRKTRNIVNDDLPGEMSSESDVEIKILSFKNEKIPCEPKAPVAEESDVSGRSSGGSQFAAPFALFGGRPRPAVLQAGNPEAAQKKEEADLFQSLRVDAAKRREKFSQETLAQDSKERIRNALIRHLGIGTNPEQLAALEETLIEINGDVIKVAPIFAREDFMRVLNNAFPGGVVSPNASAATLVKEARRLEAEGALSTDGGASADDGCISTAGSSYHEARRLEAEKALSKNGGASANDGCINTAGSSSPKVRSAFFQPPSLVDEAANGASAVAATDCQPR